MKTMKQPRKDVLREQLALAADEIIHLRRVNEAERQISEYLLASARRMAGQLATPWWRRLLTWGRA